MQVFSFRLKSGPQWSFHERVVADPVKSSIRASRADFPVVPYSNSMYGLSVFVKARGSRYPFAA
jgi:hypothetical protein